MEQRGDGGFVSVGGVGQNHVLIRAQTKFDSRKLFRHFAQRHFLRVFHPAGFHEHAEKPFSIRGFAPVEQVGGRRELARLRGRKRDARAFVHLVLHEFYAAFGHDVLQARVFAVGAVAEIAVNREHGFRDLHQFVWREKADDIRESGKVCVFP